MVWKIVEDNKSSRGYIVMQNSDHQKSGSIYQNFDNKYYANKKIFL